MGAERRERNRFSAISMPAVKRWDIWIRISPRFRDVAQLVYNDMDQNVDTMMAELTRQ